MTIQLKIARVPEVLGRLDVSRSTLARFERNDPTFPKKFKIGVRSIGFLESEIDAWIQSRAASGQQQNQTPTPTQ